MLPDGIVSALQDFLDSLNAPSGAGCSLTPLLGGAWLQRFQELDRHRPAGALPEVVGTGPFLPPFVGMTPLATDGPGSGSGAGFGRDHAEKWQSRGVSHTTVAVIKTTDSAGRSESAGDRQRAGGRAGARCSHGVARDGVSARLCDSSHLACDSRIDALPKEVPTRHWMKWAVAVQNVRVINVTHGPLIQVELRLIGKRTAQAREQVLIRDPLVF